MISEQLQNEQLAEYGIKAEEITVISAGFPCQPYSLAGKGRGDRDERDLWGEVARVLGEVKPRWFVGENTPGLFARQNQRYFRRVLNDLTALGYRVGWGIWGACDVGAPHKRDRVFFLAYADGERRGVLEAERNATCQEVGGRKDQTETPFGTGAICRNIPDAYGDAERRLPFGTETAYALSGIVCEHVSDTDSERQLQSERIEQDFGRWTCDSSWWQVEPDVGRLAYGIPSRVDRLRCLGNAVVPEQAYPIFEAIAKYELSQRE